MVDLSAMVEGSLDWPVDGKIYKLDPIKIKEMGSFTQWVENKYIQDMIKISESLPQDKSTDFLTKALKEKPSGIELTERVSKAMSTLEGTKELLFLSLRKNHLDMTREKLDEIVTFKNIRLAQDLLDSVSGFTQKKEDEKKADGEDSKNEDENPDEKKKVTGGQSSASSRRLMDGPQNKSENSPSHS